MEKSNIGHRLKRLREKNGMTQNQVANYLNVTRSAYSYYEINKTEPSIQTIITLSRIYKVSTDEILLPKKRKTYLGKFDI